jgi:predicted small lipoprotein YifL
MRWLLMTVIILQTATCGQKGPLHLPDGENNATSQFVERG